MVLYECLKKVEGKPVLPPDRPLHLLIRN